MAAEAQTWHYLVAAVAFLASGVIGHVLRAVFNLFPDRLSDRPMTDLVVSDSCNGSDHLFGTDYDDAGYDRLDSLKNLKLSCVLSLIGGLAVMVCSRGASIVFAGAIDTSLEWIGTLFRQRQPKTGWSRPVFGCRLCRAAIGYILSSSLRKDVRHDAPDCNCERAGHP